MINPSPRSTERRHRQTPAHDTGVASPASPASPASTPTGATGAAGAVRAAGSDWGASAASGVPQTGRRRMVLVGLLGAASLSAAFGWGARPKAEQAARRVPAFNETGAEAAAPAEEEIAILAGGCFWGVQAVYQHLGGVRNAVSGYAGGDKASADYAQVSRGATAHAEAVAVRFDPRVVRYDELLQVFFSVVHDPTQLDRQGPDIGPQYRSAIFPVDARQAAVAQRYIEQLGTARTFDAKIVTRVETMRQFFPAEDYHQDYLVRHPDQPYIVANDLPKLEDLRRLFPERYRKDPILVAAAGLR